MYEKIDPWFLHVLLVAVLYFAWYVHRDDFFSRIFRMAWFAFYSAWSLYTLLRVGIYWGLDFWRPGTIELFACGCIMAFTVDVIKIRAQEIEVKKTWHLT